MQKLDFTEGIDKLENILLSSSIVDFIDKTPSNNRLALTPLTQLIIESKSNFDKLSVDSNEYKIIESLGGTILFHQEYLSDLLNTISSITNNPSNKSVLYLNEIISKFLIFHLAITKISHVAKEVFFDEKKLFDTAYDDIIIFRVLVEHIPLQIKDYKKILVLLDELIEILQKINNQEEQCSAEIVLLDSGSDSNIGIKTTKEVASSLFDIFKVVWDWVITRKYYKNKLRNDAIIDNLKVMKELKEAEENQTIDADTARKYRELILRKTEDLLELNVLPKSIVEESQMIANRKILDEYKEQKLID